MYQIGEPEIQALSRVIKSKRLFRYLPGDPSESILFEREWAEKIGVPFCIAVSSGTSALTCALVAAGVEPGDEVLVPGFTFMATALAPLAIGAVPVLCDVDEALMLDPLDVARKITSRTKAIIPVHMNGHLVNLDPILKLARERNLKVVEDACQCVGGSYKGQRAGSLGDAAAYSFNFFKIISAGEGGAFVTKDLAGYQRAKIYHDTGTAWRADAKDLIVPLFAGLNCRIDELRATVLREQAKRLDGILAGLRKNVATLRELLSGGSGYEFAPVHSPEGDAGVCLYLRVENRARALALSEGIKKRGGAADLPADSGRHIYSNWEPLMQRRGAFHPAIDPLHTTEAGRAQKYTPDALPRTLENLARIVSIPTNFDASADDLACQAKILREAATVRESARVS